MLSLMKSIKTRFASYDARCNTRGTHPFAGDSVDDLGTCKVPWALYGWPFGSRRGARLVEGVVWLGEHASHSLPQYPSACNSRTLLHTAPPDPLTTMTPVWTTAISSSWWMNFRNNSSTKKRRQKNTANCPPFKTYNKIIVLQFFFLLLFCFCFLHFFVEK